MGSINENIASNIIRLRKQFSLTQQELANKLHYTDKAISKWERGESVPDVEVLNSVANIFGVSIEFLISEHSEKELASLTKERKIFDKNWFFIILLSLTIMLVAIIIYLGAMYTAESNRYRFWVIFPWIVPSICIVLYSFCLFKRFRKRAVLFGTIALWTALICIYLSLHVSGYSHLWHIFLIAVPLQLAVILMYLFSYKKPISKEI